MERSIREIKTKKPWGNVVTDPGMNKRPEYTLNNEPQVIDDVLMFKQVTQADMIRQYYPSAHLINSSEYYPNIHRTEEVEILDENGNPTGHTQKMVYTELVPRFAFAFQQLITCKQLVHLCGNDIQFDLLTSEPTDAEQNIIDEFRKGWLEKDMEVAFFLSQKSKKITGDGAIVGYMDKGKFCWKLLSYTEGDVLYPHYDSYGHLEIFARVFHDYAEDGTKTTEWVEVWDDQNLYRFKRDESADGTFIGKIKGLFGLNGYKLVDTIPHGFGIVPVAYIRDNNGACWSASQDAIDNYELAFSQMAHNNRAYGEPILCLQGDDVSTVPGMNGSIKLITMGKEDKAEYLKGQSASDSYIKQLDTTYKLIYEMSFAVVPPQISGNSDISGAAIKILYSPAVEKATNEAHEVQPFLNDLVNIFAIGYGIESEKQLDFTNIPMKAWVKPFIHINESAIVNDLVQSVNAGFCSKQTASEKIQFYTEVGEWSRIMQESKEQQESDLLYQIETSKAQAEVASENNNNDNNNE